MDVVIVDDDAVVLFLHKILIQKTFHSGCLHDFDNAEEALQYILHRTDKNQPLLVLLDINMPGMTGWHFLEELQENAFEENIHVVMVTSSINYSDRKKAEQFPLVMDFLEKPLSRQACAKLYEQLTRKS
ncbi:MAG: response regulator [Salinimicrobium sp.]